MISGKQFKNMIDYMFSGAAGFIAPTAVFTATPNTYVSTSIPATDVLTGTITENNGVLTTWAITYGTSSTPIATGVGTTVTHTLTGANIPSTIGTHIYYLTVTYTDSNSASQSFVVSTTIVVTAAALQGQLNGTEDITVATDLTAGMEATLVTTDQATVINLFTVTAAAALGFGRIIFVVPDSYGTVTSIEDGAGLDVLNTFNAVIDAANSRVIYTMINTVVVGSYDYKLVF